MYVVRIDEPMCKYEVDVLFIIWHMCLIKFLNVIRGLLEKYPTFGREKETGLLGALDT